MRSLKTPWNVTLRFDDGDINVGLDEWKQSGCFSSALFSLGLLLHVTLTGLDYSAQKVARASDVKSGTETQSLSVNLAGQQSSRWEKHSEHDLIPASLSSPRVVNLLSSLPCSQVLLNSLPWIFSCFTDHLRGFLSTMDVLYLKSQPVVYTRAPLSFNMFLSLSSSPAAASNNNELPHSSHAHTYMFALQLLKHRDWRHHLHVWRPQTRPRFHSQSDPEHFWSG